jgi:hypothetical protein
MSAMYIRGGLPIHVSRTTANNALEEWPIPGGQANFLIFRNTGANSILLSLNRQNAEAAAAEGYTVGTTLGVDDVLEVPAEIGSFWTLSAVGASSFDAIAFVRRG